MNTFSIYDIYTGLFTGGQYQGPSASLREQLDHLPENLSYVMGAFDHLSQRVDLATGDVVDYVPEQPGPRWQWHGETKRWIYVPDDAELLWTAQQGALSLINARCAETLAGVRYSYPADEVTSWAKQENEARAWLADSAAPTPLIRALSAARGVPLAILAQKIVDKADAFAATSGQIIGQRQAREDAIEAAVTVADVRAVLADALPNDPNIDYVLAYKS